MELTVSRADDGASDGRTTLSVVGFIDLSNSQALVDAGTTELASGGSLAVDLAAVDFMDSTGLSALIGLAQAAERSGQSFIVAAMSPRVRRVLELTGLEDRWLPPEASDPARAAGQS